MNTLILLPGWREFLAKGGWLFIWLIFVATAVLAVYDYRELKEKVKNSTGRHKKIACARLVLNILVPVLAFIAAVSSQVGSDIADAKISSLEMNLQSAKDAATNATLVAETAIGKVAALNPSKQPISSITANAHFTIKGNVKPNPWATNEINNYPGFGFFQLLWGSREQVLTSHFMFGLTAHKYTWMPGPGFADVSLEFYQDAENAFWHLKPPPLAEVVNELKAVQIRSWLLPDNSEILSGRITITANSIRKEFPIPPQQVRSWHQITSIVSNGWVYGLPALEGTNVLTPVMPYPTNMIEYEYRRR